MPGPFTFYGWWEVVEQPPDFTEFSFFTTDSSGFSLFLITHFQPQDSCARFVFQRKARMSSLLLQNIEKKLDMQAMVLQVAAWRGFIDMIELLAPIDIGKSLIEKSQTKAYTNAG